MITFATGDMWETPDAAYVVPVNCVGVAGAGVAKQAAARFSGFVTHLKDALSPLSPLEEIPRPYRLAPGKVVLYDTIEGDRVFMAATKDDWRHPSRIAWVEECIVNLQAMAAQFNIDRLAVPKLGCGLGGLTWPDVRALMVEYWSHDSIQYIVYGAPE